jgi:signal peptidase I
MESVRVEMPGFMLKALQPYGKKITDGGGRILHRSRSSEWLITVLIAVLLAMTIRLYFYAPYRVYGSSMLPTLRGDELLIVNKWIYDQRSPSYGDIIVFHTEEDRDFIKRVVGLPGDEIAIHGGHVWRNGKKLEEPYILSEIQGDYPKTRVPPGHLFVLGDNRNRSRDSREIGMVDIDEVVGRAELVLFPLDRIQLLIR